MGMEKWRSIKNVYKYVPSWAIDHVSLINRLYFLRSQVYCFEAKVMVQTLDIRSNSLDLMPAQSNLKFGQEYQGHKLGNFYEENIGISFNKCRKSEIKFNVHFKPSFHFGERWILIKNRACVWGITPAFWSAEA